MLHMEVVQKEADRWIGGREPGNNQHPYAALTKLVAVAIYHSLPFTLLPLRELGYRIK
jgi:hypothetical protein